MLIKLSARLLWIFLLFLILHFFLFVSLHLCDFLWFISGELERILTGDLVLLHKRKFRFKFIILLHYSCGCSLQSSIHHCKLLNSSKARVCEVFKIHLLICFYYCWCPEQAKNINYFVLFYDFTGKLFRLYLLYSSLSHSRGALRFRSQKRA
jgi:hypothetical protein